MKKSYEAIPNNFKVPSSTIKGSAVQKSSSVGPIKCDAATLIKTSLFSPIRTKTTFKIKTISKSSKQVSGSPVPPYCLLSNHKLNQKKKGTWPLVNISFNSVVLSIKFASSQPKEIVGESRNHIDSLIQKKENKRSQPGFNLASVFINEKDLPVENALVVEGKDITILQTDFCKAYITEFLYGANTLIFDWFCFNLEEKRVFIFKYGREV